MLLKHLRHFPFHWNSPAQGKPGLSSRSCPDTRTGEHLPTERCSELAALPEVGINPSEIVSRGTKGRQRKEKEMITRKICFIGAVCAAEEAAPGGQGGL